ncbi:MAG: VOC family protein [Deinococcota bacterium]
MPLVPELYVADIAKSLSFYVDLLGFHIEYQRPEEGFAKIALEDAALMLETFHSRQPASRDEFKQGRWRTAAFEYPLGRGINFEITVVDIEPAYLRLKQASYPLKLDVYNKQYRVNDHMIAVRQFLVMDPDGYLIRLAQETSVHTLL